MYYLGNYIYGQVVDNLKNITMDIKQKITVKDILRDNYSNFKKYWYEVLKQMRNHIDEVVKKHWSVVILDMDLLNTNVQSVERVQKSHLPVKVNFVIDGVDYIQWSGRKNKEITC